MTEAIYSWMQNLVCYFILLSAVMNLLPDSSYKKYIRYYMGLLLILVMLSPVFDITHIQEQIDAYISESLEEEEEKDTWQRRAETWEADWNRDTEVIEGREVVP